MQIKLNTLIVYLFLFLLLVLSFLKFASPVVNGLDPSWVMTLAYAFKHHWQAGVDYIFTYGPLGYFSSPHFNYYDNEIFNYTVMWSMLMSGVLALIFLIKMSQLHNNIEKFLYFIALIIISNYLGDVVNILSIVTATLLILKPTNFFNQNSVRYFGLVTAILGFLVVLSLTKFSYSLLIAICLLTILIHIGYKHNYQTALKFLAIFICMFLGLWTLLNQSIFNIPSFLLNSLEIVSGYDAMSLERNRLIDYYIAFPAIALISIMVWVAYLSKPYKLENVLSSVIVFSGLFLAWKAGFVRHDGHVLIFFNTLLFLPFLIHRPVNSKTLFATSFNWLFFLTVFTVVIGVFNAGSQLHNFLGVWNIKIINNLVTLSSLNKVKQQHFATMSQLKRKNNLPRIKATVVQSTVDIFSPAQGIVLANDLNYHPRPIFQGYGAYNEKLLNFNAEFYAGNSPPEFVLFKITPIDNRLPLMEDSQVLKILARDYRQVLREKTYVLLKREPRGTGVVVNTTSPLLTKSIRFNEVVDIKYLSDKNLNLSLNIKPSFLGNLTKLFFKLPEVFLNMKTVNDKQLVYRIIPSMVNTDLMFNPLIRNENDWIAWGENKFVPRIASFSVSLKPQLTFTSNQLQKLFMPEITVQIKEHEIIPRMSKEAMLYPDFNVIPYAVSSSHSSESISENGVRVFKVQSPSEIRFRVNPGHHIFSCEFGILKDAYTAPNKSDGVEFSASLITEDGEESMIFKQFVNPLQVESDKNVQKWESAFTMRIPNTLVLRANPGPANDSRWDQAFWRAVKLQ